MKGRARAIASGLLVTVTSVALVGVANAAAADAPPHPEATHAAASATAGSVGLPPVDPAVAAKNDQVLVQRYVAAVNAANNARWYEAASATVERAAAASRTVHRTSAGSSGSNVLDC